MTPETEFRVLVAVLTFRRPLDLEDLLPALIDQAATVRIPVEILVVDNDPDAGARAQVGEFASTGLTRYVHESTPGIAAARNRALDEASGFDLLVFIDDDERPTRNWLAELLATHAGQRPAAVVGPVLSRYDIEPGMWIRAGRFFERRRFRTGTPVSVAATNNLLLDLDQVRRLDLRFDERFGISGGSDSLFTRQLNQRGGRMIWCDEAVVIDVVPAARLTREWVLRRAYRIGNAWSRIHLSESSPRRRLIVRGSLFARGGVRLVGGAARYAVGLLTDQLGNRARGLRTAARGAGMLAGSVGAVYHEYGRPVRMERARLYHTLRSAYLERAHKLPPAAIIYRVRRYDFHEELLAGLDVVQAGPVRAAWLLSRSPATRLEINEPLMLSSVAGSALAILGLRVRSLFGGGRASVVSYAMENCDPSTRPAGRSLRARLRRSWDGALARFVWAQLDRVAYATDAARITYGAALPAPAAGTLSTLIPALPAACDCANEEDRTSPRVVFLGALVERKGFLLLLEAWPSVKEQMPGARLSILGKGVLEQVARDAAAGDPAIELWIDPDRSEIHRQLRRGSVLALPSQPTPLWREQVGLPIVEGLAHGSVIVTTTETGLADWLSRHGHGVIAPGSGPGELADALVLALQEGRSAASVTADLPAIDGRLAADAWLFADAVTDGR